jgi:hypothetical protein
MVTKKTPSRQDRQGKEDTGRNIEAQGSCVFFFNSIFWILSSLLAFLASWRFSVLFIRDSTYPVT